MTAFESNRIRFEQSDFEILDVALRADPQLRVCAWAIKRARIVELPYPVERAEDLYLLIDGDFFEGEGFTIRREDIPRYLGAGYFPIRSEEELISRIYVALTRCKYESARRAVIESVGAGTIGASVISRKSGTDT